MDVKKAVQAAKKWVGDVMSDESVSNIGLEEVEHDDANHLWRITIGFSRPWNSHQRTNALSAFTSEPSLKRAYRVITIVEPNGEVVSMKKRAGDES